MKPPMVATPTMAEIKGRLMLALLLSLKPFSPFLSVRSGPCTQLTRDDNATAPTSRGSTPVKVRARNIVLNVGDQNRRLSRIVLWYDLTTLQIKFNLILISNYSQMNPRKRTEGPPWGRK